MLLKKLLIILHKYIYINTINNNMHKLPIFRYSVHQIYYNIIVIIRTVLIIQLILIQY